MSLSAQKTARWGGAAKILVSLAGFVIVVAGLRAASPLIVPFLLAVFIAIICAPPLFWLQRQGVRKWLALVLMFAAVIGATTLLGLIVGHSVGQFTAKLPLYQQRLTELTAPWFAWLAKRGVAVPTEYFQVGSAMQYAGSFLSSVASLLADAFLILLTVIFILLEAANLPDKLRAALPGRVDPLVPLKGFMAGVNRYVAIKTAVSAATGLGAFLLCLVMRVEYALLWGVLAFVLNFVPNIGSVVAAVPPVLLALIMRGVWPAVAVAAGYVAINVILGTFLEPRLLGRGVGMSALVVFLSLVFWGWVLGPVGMVLSVPLTMVMKIALANSPETRWLAVLLGPSEAGAAAAQAPVPSPAPAA